MLEELFKVKLYHTFFYFFIKFIFLIFFLFSGWLNAYKEGEWLPTWASPGYRNCMVGTFADAVISDAIVKDIKGFDLDLAIEAVIKDVSYLSLYINILIFFLKKIIFSIRLQLDLLRTVVIQ